VTALLLQPPSAVGPPPDTRPGSAPPVIPPPPCTQPRRLPIRAPFRHPNPCSSPVALMAYPAPPPASRPARERRGHHPLFKFPQKISHNGPIRRKSVQRQRCGQAGTCEPRGGNRGWTGRRPGTGIPLTIEIRSPDHPGPTPVVRGPAHLKHLYSLVFVAMGTASGPLRRSFSEFDRLDDSDRADRRGARPMPSTPQAITRPHATRLAPRAPPVSFRRRSSSVVSTRTTRTRRTSSTRCVST